MQYYNVTFVTEDYGKPTILSFPTISEAYRACSLCCMIKQGGGEYKRTQWHADDISAAQLLHFAKVITRKQLVDIVEAASNASNASNDSNESADDETTASVDSYLLICMSALLVELIDGSRLRGSSLQSLIVSRWTEFSTAAQRDIAVASFRRMISLQPQGELECELAYEHWHEVAFRGNDPGKEVPAISSDYDAASLYQRNLALAVLACNSVIY